MSQSWFVTGFSCRLAHPAVVCSASFSVQLGVAFLNQFGKFVFQRVTVGTEDVGSLCERQRFPSFKLLEHLPGEWRELLGNAWNSDYRRRLHKTIPQTSDLRFQCPQKEENPRIPIDGFPK